MMESEKPAATRELSSRDIDSSDTAGDIHETESEYVKSKQIVLPKTPYLYMLGMLSGPRLALL